MLTIYSQAQQAAGNNNRDNLNGSSSEDEAEDGTNICYHFVLEL